MVDEWKGAPLPCICPSICLPAQGLPEAAAAAERAEGDAEELRSLPQAATLAVVAALHQGEEGTWEVV